METHHEIRHVLDRVRRRWRGLRAFQAAVRVALAAAVIVALAMVAARWADRAPLALAVIALLALVLIVAGAVWGLLPLRGVPDDRRVARFIEERDPSLDHRLISAVDVAANPSA